MKKKRKPNVKSEPARNINPRNMKEVAKKIFALISALLPGAASFFITAGWNWYHIPHTQKMVLMRNTAIETIILWILFTVAKKILIAFLRRKNLNPFWI